MTPRKLYGQYLVFNRQSTIINRQSMTGVIQRRFSAEEPALSEAEGILRAPRELIAAAREMLRA